MGRRRPDAKEPSLPWIVAHRGARQEAPDNTRSAFDVAVACGVEGIECDVQLTVDGVPVLYHDRTLAKVGGGRRRVADHTLRELRSLDWGGWFDPSFSGEPVMTLEEALRRYGRRTSLFIEIKSRPRDRAGGRHLDLTRVVVALLRRHLPRERLRETVFLLSFDGEVLDRAAAEEPHWNYVLNVKSPPAFRSGGLPRQARLFGCNLPVKNLTPSFAERARRRGLKVLTYACNVPLQVRRALDCGADVIMTDNPRWLVKRLGGRGDG
jgi:glycerophosphoryl diester phosphodiesterase